MATQKVKDIESQKRFDKVVDKLYEAWRNSLTNMTVEFKQDKAETFSFKFDNYCRCKKAVPETIPMSSNTR